MSLSHLLVFCVHAGFWKNAHKSIRADANSRSIDNAIELHRLNSSFVPLRGRRCGDCDMVVCDCGQYENCPWLLGCAAGVTSWSARTVSPAGRARVVAMTTNIRAVLATRSGCTPGTCVVNVRRCVQSLPRRLLTVREQYNAVFFCPAVKHRCAAVPLSGSFGASSDRLVRRRTAYDPSPHGTAHASTVAERRFPHVVYATAYATLDTAKSKATSTPTRSQAPRRKKVASRSTIIPIRVSVIGPLILACGARHV